MSMYYGQYDVDSSNMPADGFNFGSDLGGSIPGFQHENIGPPSATAVGWSVYNSQSSEFFNSYVDTDSIYGSNDKELVLRNSLMMKTEDEDSDDRLFQNFTPLAKLTGGELSDLTNITGNSTALYVGDGHFNYTPWTVSYACFDSNGNYDGSEGGNRITAQFSTSPTTNEQVNLIAITSSLWEVI